MNTYPANRTRTNASMPAVAPKAVPGVKSICRTHKEIILEGNYFAPKAVPGVKSICRTPPCVCVCVCVYGCVWVWVCVCVCV